MATEGRPDKDFLTRIANEVGERFPPGSRSREWLRKQVKIAIEQQNAHDQAVQKRTRELALHYRRLQRKLIWRDKSSGPPKGHSEWVWCLWDLPVEHFTNKMVGGCLTDEDDPCKAIEGWGPPELLDESAIPPEPIHWLYPFGDPKRPPKQVIPAQCLILGVVHDVARRGKGFELILQGMPLPPAFQVYLDFQTDDGSAMTGFDCGSIGLALRSVREKLGSFERDAENETKEQPSADHAAAVEEGATAARPKNVSHCASKRRFMDALGFDSLKKFNAWAKGKIHQAGNRQLWQFDLAKLSESEEKKIDRI